MKVDPTCLALDLGLALRHQGNLERSSQQQLGLDALEVMTEQPLQDLEQQQAQLVVVEQLGTSQCNGSQRCSVLNRTLAPCQPELQPLSQRSYHMRG